jgi:hypothetical protein
MEIFYRCKCPKPTYPWRHFDALRDFSESVPHCDVCGDIRELRAKFTFGLEGGTDQIFKVRAVFLPHTAECWKKENGARVCFHPFLVVLESANGGTAFWLPYWHTEELENGTMKTKAGQWAPLMDSRLFESLIGQARERGYLTDAALTHAAKVS